MNKLFNKLITVVLVCLIFPCFVHSEEVNKEDIIRVPVELVENQGICSARIKIEYDKQIFKLLSMENGDVFPLSSYTAGNIEAESCYAVWMGLSDIKSTGVLLYLNFEVLEKLEPDNYEIKISYDANDVFNLNEENITIKINNPVISVDNENNDTTHTNPSNSSSGGTSLGKRPTIIKNTQKGTFENFKKKRAYASQFADVSENDWFYDDVKFGYEFNFINGKGDDIYDPNGNITIAEALTLASNIRCIYYGEQKPTNSSIGKWYDDIVKYAITNKIIDANDFTDYDKMALRSEMAYVFANALPTECYERLNYIEKVYDMHENELYYNDILKLYIAGILTGTDEVGSFQPNEPVKRSEAAAIINRVVVPSARIER